MSKVLGRNVRMQAVLGSTWESAPAAAGPIGPGPEPGPARWRSAPGRGNLGSSSGHGSGSGSRRRAMERCCPDHPADPPVADDQRRGESPSIPSEIDEPIVKAALKLFGGTITRIERKEAEQS